MSEISVKVKLLQASSLLNLFIDESIDDLTPFRDIRKTAFSLVNKKDILLNSDYMADIKWDVTLYVIYK